MVNGDGLAKLQRLAQEHRIYQRAQSDPWPDFHRPTFEAIQRLHEITAESYVAGVASGAAKPWKRYNLNIAGRLAKESSELNARAANESTWRMGIENLIVRRFSIEVAWYVST